MKKINSHLSKAIAIREMLNSGMKSLEVAKALNVHHQLVIKGGVKIHCNQERKEKQKQKKFILPRLLNWVKINLQAQKMGLLVRSPIKSILSSLNQERIQSSYHIQLLTIF